MAPEPTHTPQAPQTPSTQTDELVETLVEEVSIDGMCGVY